MSNLSEKIDWAINTFNDKIHIAQKNNLSLVEVAKENLGLLYYVKIIYPQGKFPAWARNQVDADAKIAAEKAGFKF
jgi:hypothetical protein